MIFASTDISQLAEERGLRLEENRVSRGGAAATLEPGPNGHYGLSLTENSRTLRLTSAINPAAEDKRLVEKFSFDPAKGVLCLGLGLGYYVEELAGRMSPDAPLWVMESRPELAAAALMRRDFSKLMARGGFRLLIGPFDRVPPDAPTQVLTRPAVLRHFRSEYPQLAEAAPKKRIKKILVFQSDYYLDRELAGTLTAMGLDVAAWHFKRGESAQGGNYNELLKIIRDFRPDMALTVNHLGFDAGGVMDDLFNRLSLPVASWFVDSPLFILGDTKPGPAATLFTWDSDYLEPLRSKGFHNVHYLPLAADDRFFHPYRLAKPERDIAFVGDTLTAASLKYLGKLHLSENVLERADAAAVEFLGASALMPDVRALMETLRLPPGSETELDLAALVTWRASRRWRLDVLSALPKNRLTLAGDDKWPGLLGQYAHSLPALDYYTELPTFYRASRVNINITSAQMKSGLNQRVFDVPASGAFLLTDSRAQLAALFEPGREVVTYSSPIEAAELAGWYLDNPAARDTIVNAAYKAVKSRHLYRHRLAEMLRIMAGETS